MPGGGGGPSGGMLSRSEASGEHVKMRLRQPGRKQDPTGTLPFGRSQGFRPLGVWAVSGFFFGARISAAGHLGSLDTPFCAVLSLEWSPTLPP